MKHEFTLALASAVLLVPLAHAQDDAGVAATSSGTPPPVVAPTVPAPAQMGDAVYVLCAERDARCNAQRERECDNIIRAARAGGAVSATNVLDSEPTDNIDHTAMTWRDSSGTTHDIVSNPCDYATAVQVDVEWRTSLRAADQQVAQDPDLWRPLAPDTTAAEGSAAQATAIGSIVPSPTGGAIANYAHANDLNYLVVAASINPFGLGLPRERWAPRLMDISGVLPVTLGADGSVAALSSAGLRVRVDIVGAVRAAYGDDSDVRLAAATAAYHGAFVAAFGRRRLTDSDFACIAGLMSGGSDHCENVDAAPLLAAAETLALVLDHRRRELDSFYGGLEGRYDHGDPDLLGVLPLDSNSGSIALVGGFRLQSPTLLFGGRLRAAYRGIQVPGNAGATPPVAATGHDQIEYGTAIEAGFIADRRAYRLSLGIDGQYYRDEADPALTVDRGRFRAGVSIPVSDAVAVSIGVTYPFGDGVNNQVAVVGGLEVQGADPSR